MFNNKKAQVGARLRGAWTTGRDYIQNNNINIFIITALVVHLIKWGLNFNNARTAYIDIAYALLVLFVFFNRSTRTADIWRGVIIVCALEIFLPSLLSFEAMRNNDYLRLYLLNRLLTPWWFYYAAAISGGSTRFSSIVRVGIIVFWFGVAMTVPAVGFSELKSQAVGAEQIDAATELLGKTKDFYFTTVKNAWNGLLSIPDMWKRQMDIATGGLYTGRVDENQKELLGVYIDGIKPSSSEFFRDESASVWATLRVKTLDDGIKVNLRCFAGSKDINGDYVGNKEGTVYPPSIPRIYDLEQEDIDCSFAPNMLDSGSERVALVADFNFETMAYLKTYFMNKELIRSMQSQGLDPLGEYGIKDDDPIAIFTNGPVQIGMGFSEPPVGIPTSVEQRLGVTVESNFGWDGQIREIKELMIQIPNSMDLDLTTCTHPFVKDDSATHERCVDGYKYFRSRQFRECADDVGLDLDKDFNADGEPQKEQQRFNDCLQKQCAQEYDGYNTYYLDTSYKPQTLKNIQDYRTFSCRVSLSKPSEILGNSPLSTKYFRAKARYEYRVEEETHVKIKRVAGEPVTGPEPTKEGVANVPFVYKTYNDYIRKYCTIHMAGLLGEEECVCLVTGMINQESGGSVSAVSSAGAQGLMQIVPETAKGIAADLKLTSFNIFDPETNINFGIYYISQRLKHYAGKTDKTNQIKLALAAYNWGEGNIDPRCCPNGVCMSFDSCVGSLATETQNYVPKIMSYMQTCMDLQLYDMGILETAELNKDTFLEDYSSHSISLVGGKQEIDLGNGLSIMVSDRNGYLTTTTYKVYEVSLYYHGYRLYRDTVSYADGNKDGIEYFYEDYPFVRFKFSDNGAAILTQAWKKTVVFPEKLEEDAVTLTTEGRTTKKLTPIWTQNKVSYVKAYYDGKYIYLYDEKDRNFCKVPWERDSIYAYCSGDEMPGITVKNVETQVKEINGIQPYAKVQFIYDPDFQHNCCDTCTGCTTIGCLSCGSKCGLRDGISVYETTAFISQTGECILKI